MSKAKPKTPTRHRSIKMTNKVPSEIVVNKRHRKDMGDLQGLADSIQELGLLQPIVITPDNQLIAGERRLRVVRDVLKLDSIECKIVDCDALLGEHDENLMRKDFAVSERVAIADEVRTKIGDRRFKKAEATETTNGEGAATTEEKTPDVEPGKETRAAAAEAAGFESHRNYEQARKVVQKGAAEVVEAMDAGTVSIRDAASVAELPKSKQKAALKMVLKGEARTLRQAAQESDTDAAETNGEGAGRPPMLDEGDVELPDDCIAAFEEVSEFRRLARDIGGLIDRVELLARGPAGRCVFPDAIKTALKNAAKGVSAARPARLCPYCKGASKKAKDCDACKAEHWVTHAVWKQSPDGGGAAKPEEAQTQEA